MAIAESHGLPIAVCTYEASCHEVKLVEKTLSNRFVKAKPRRMIGDKAYDSDKLDKQMKQKKIKLISPHKANRKSKPTQDGRS